MPESLPENAVVRVSRVTFDPDLYDEVTVVDGKTAQYLIPAIQQLPGLLHWFAGVSAEGSFVQISVWDSEEHAVQMDRLTEMAVIARGEFREVGVEFTPEHASIVNYPITWTI
ncbi:hypothetical protein [Nocardia sp. BMG111209]|uniref:hypothetical protein n=1 Tax=Nocardia sp. BMG111209 TaxID=1160137 RepID=UPI0003706CD7|nr:hypothetical protein [Nocardia sp. BMG111209]